MNKKRTTLYKLILRYMLAIDLIMALVIVIVNVCFTKILTSTNPTGFSQRFSICSILFVVLFAIFQIFLGIYLCGSIRKGFQSASDIANEIAIGNLDVEIPKLKYEFVQLMEDYEKLVAASKKQVEIAHAVASGNLTIEVEPRSEVDGLGIELKEMVIKNRETLGQINEASIRVGRSAIEVAKASENLAYGSSEQASAVEMIEKSVQDVNERTQENAQKSTLAANLAIQTLDNVQKGNEQMQAMTNAMNEINASSESISKIIKVIDDIAFQTNILALNAAVEAARAGAAGKGFAVVADEVRNLAGKSGAAASETASLIEDSIEKVNAGSKIVIETAKAFDEITATIKQSDEIIKEIAKASLQQVEEIKQIDFAIEQVNRVVQTNSATSQESAAASSELSKQAKYVEELIERYHI